MRRKKVRSEFKVGDIIVRPLHFDKWLVVGVSEMLYHCRRADGKPEGGLLFKEVAHRVYVKVGRDGEDD